MKKIKIVREATVSIGGLGINAEINELSVKLADAINRFNSQKEVKIDRVEIFRDLKFITHYTNKD